MICTLLYNVNASQRVTRNINNAEQNQSEQIKNSTAQKLSSCSSLQTNVKILTDAQDPERSAHTPHHNTHDASYDPTDAL